MTKLNLSNWKKQTVWMLLAIGVAACGGSDQAPNAADGTMPGTTPGTGMEAGSDPAPGTGEPDIPVSGVIVSPSHASLSIGESTVFSATVMPPNATDPSVVWTTSDPSVASVGASGIMIGLAVGSVQITATTTEGSFVASATVDVSTPGVPVAGVTVSPASVSLTVAQTRQLSATITPVNATGPTVTWSSNDTSVAIVSSNGLVTAVSSGNTDIQATTSDGGFSATASVVVAPVAANDLTIHSTGFVAGLVTDPSVDLTTNLASSATRSIANRVYESFDDDFDFIILVTNVTDRPTDITYYGRFSPVSNGVEGTGNPIYNNGASYGSGGTLKGIIHLPYRRGIRFGPFLHELAHQWGNDILDSVVGGHWGFLGFDGARGQLGGFNSQLLQDLGGGVYTAGSFGLFANGGNSIAYSDLELYLMGMLDASQVGNLTIVTGGAFVPGTANFTASSVVTTPLAQVLMDNLILPRMPSAATSQKNFRILTLLISDTAISAAEFAEVSTAIENFSMLGDDGNDNNFTFNEATRFVGTMTAGDLASSLK